MVWILFMSDDSSNYNLTNDDDDDENIKGHLHGAKSQPSGKLYTSQ